LEKGLVKKEGQRGDSRMVKWRRFETTLKKTGTTVIKHQRRSHQKRGKRDRAGWWGKKRRKRGNRGG